jgi:hypothetical protein
MENWYEFTAYNSQPHYGYGTQTEADAYCDILNRNREVGQYHYRQMDSTETGRLDSGEDCDGFKLDLALDSQAEQDEWRAEQNILAPRE